jgi:outer membrane receptor for monomeric catechols
VPSHWQLDAYASYQLTDQVRLQLNATNLTNELTYERVHPGRQAYPGTGRTFILSTAFNF